MAGTTLFDLSGRTAVVTGASRGLGSYFARALATAGADVAVTSRSADRLGETCEAIQAVGKQALPVSMDVTSYESIQEGIAGVIARFGKIDILVNNAGLNIRKPAIDLTWDDWNTVLDTNLRGQFFVAQAVARHMISREYGRIINIGSETTVSGFAVLTPYCASRGGVKQMTMSLADDWGKHGITVNVLSPGFFETEQTKVLYENEGWVEYITEKIPLNRPGRPHDLDGAVVFLASEASEYVTGQNILVDGGVSVGSTRVTAD